MYPHQGPCSPFLKTILRLSASLISPRSSAFAQELDGWRRKGRDVIAGQGEQSVGRDVDAGMTGA